jgi:uncharacterized lipoprotein YmbA
MNNHQSAKRNCWSHSIWLVSLCLLACCAPAPKVSYYSLLDTTLLTSTDAQVNGLAVSVGPVTINDVFNRSQIVTEGENGVYTMSEFRRWTSNLSDEIARALAELLALDLQTDRVSIFPEGQFLKVDCRVAIDVISMNGMLGKDANLIIRWALVDPNGKKPPVIRKTQLKRHPRGDGYLAWVEAQQENLKELGTAIAAAIKKF